MTDPSNWKSNGSLTIAPWQNVVVQVYTDREDFSLQSEYICTTTPVVCTFKTTYGDDYSNSLKDLFLRFRVDDRNCPFKT